ncbi:MAG: flagellar protein FliS [Planctomycetes bacterium]|nr:flagellar protein FliS [Planctomycetota bacterium]
MNPAKLYRQNQVYSVPRIEVVLELYERILERLAKARAALATDPQESRKLTNQCCMALAGLSAAVMESGADIGSQFLRLYEFVLHSLTTRTAASLQDAINVLTVLRDGFEAIRQQAVQMEREGTIPSLNRIGSLNLTV